ncbi:MAG: cation diffusion facilitator family transporter [Candidatus Bathyarchaeia archaeon]
MISEKKRGKIGAIRYSMLVILSVFLVEVSLGLVTGSLAILSDGFHALFDFISTLIIFVSIWASTRPPDENHMYGHEKFEYLGGMIGGIMLIVLAAIIAFEASSKIIVGEPYINVDLSSVGYAALLYTLIIDLVRIFVLRIGVGQSSSGIKIAFYHALSDLCSTLIALFGFWLSTYGIFYGDSSASLILSALLTFLSVKFIWSNFMELSDTAPREAIIKIREQIIDSSGGLFTYENLKVRRIGDKFFIRATLKVPDYIGLEEAHNITTKIENNILRVLGDAEISFHIEPSGIKGVRTREFIREIVSEFKDIVDVHDINITYYDRGVHVSLHIRVDSRMPLSKAHEIAEKIERAIYESMKGVENIFVHIEPSDIEPVRGSTMSDVEMNKIVQSVIEKYGDKIRLKRIITYMAEGKRQANIECILDRSAPVEEAHKIAHEIESRIKERISESTVSVHVEPSES